MMIHSLERSLGRGARSSVAHEPAFLVQRVRHLGGPRNTRKDAKKLRGSHQGHEGHKGNIKVVRTRPAPPISVYLLKSSSVTSVTSV